MLWIEYGKRVLRNIAGALAISPVLATCTSLPSNFEMYPQAIVEDKTVDDNMAILLVGNAGPARLDYLQFGHSAMPAINVRNIVVSPKDIVAIPVPVGTMNLELNTYTVAGASGGYLSNGMSIGYIPVHTPKLDITAHGVYYVATIFPGERENFAVSPDPGVLKRFKSTHPQIASLRAVNFVWPK
jgi:hypothetical protein